jgi:hypothetical protein
VLPFFLTPGSKEPKQFPIFTNQGLDILPLDLYGFCLSVLTLKIGNMLHCTDLEFWRMPWKCEDGNVKQKYFTDHPHLVKYSMDV